MKENRLFSQLEAKRKVLVFGHRGFSQDYPENTMISFSKAAENPLVDAVELDVHLCKTGEVVISHDFSLKRTAGIDREIEDLTLEELTTIPANRPVLVRGVGELTFTGVGDVACTVSSQGDCLQGTFTGTTLSEGDYVLGRQGDEWGFVRLTAAAVLNPFGVYAALASSEQFIPLTLPSTGIMCDVNGDGIVDVEDVVGIVNYILNEPADDFIEANADLNGDGKIDVDDVVTVVNIILESFGS